MEKLQEITSQPPETPQEEWFKDTYGKLIDAAIVKLRNPTNPSHPNNSWQLFKQISNPTNPSYPNNSWQLVKKVRLQPIPAIKTTPHICFFNKPV